MTFPSLPFLFGRARGEPHRYVRPFALLGALVTLAEAAAVLGPLHTLFLFDPRQRSWLRASAPLAIGCGWLAWWLMMRLWRAPIDRAVRRHRLGEPRDAATAEAVYRASLKLPGRVAWLRSGIAGTIGVFLGLTLHRSMGLPAVSVLTFTVVSFLHVHMVQVFRSLGYARILGRVRDELVPNVPPLRLFRDQYLARLVRSALATGVLGVTAIAAFAYFFIPINLQQYQSLETWFPFPIIVLTGIWYALARRLVRPVDRYLAVATAPDAPEQAARREHLALIAYRAAQLIPAKFAIATASLWLAAEVLVVVLSWLRAFQIDLENAGILFGEALVVTVAVALYEALWHRATMRPLLVHVATHHRPRPEMVRTPLSMHYKMLTSFGGLTFFACGLSLFWSFVQYKNLATKYIQQVAALRLERVLADLRSLPARLGTPLVEAEVTLLLETEARDEAVIYYLPPSEAAGVVAVGGGKAGPPPPLPPSEEMTLRRHDRQGGSMELSALHLSGAYARLVNDEGRDLGAIAILYPGYRGRGSSIEGQIKILLYFFVMLAGASMGIVVLVVTDLTQPIRHLEQRAGAMARGDLTHPVIYLAGEADEVGRLTYAFEEMRRALNEKLRSSAEANLTLEQEVQRRTSEIERRNQELKGALDALQRAQAELVRSEKMASMGRLVAGIAHEINNPVNAVVNTAGPLASTLDELIERLGQLKPEEASEMTSDLREMLHVIQRGAHRTKEIVQALHNYSRGDDDRLVEVDLHRGIDESLDLLRHHLKNGIRVERAYGPVGKIRGYAGKLNQVFMNLLTNAAQALAAQAEKQGGQKEGLIRITTARLGDKVTIAVADNGPGIPQEVLPHIFDPFFTTKEVGQGSGLGLSIVHGIVERHGGSIAVDSEVGRGTTFTVTLPADASDARRTRPDRTPTEVIIERA
jgi:signal transduction histidine kinase